MKLAHNLLTFVLLAHLCGCNPIVGVATSTATVDPAQLPGGNTASRPIRSRMGLVQDYMVYYGTGRAAELARYDLIIVQPETLTSAELEQVHAAGTLAVAYLSVGEVEPNRAWFTDGRADPRWILGKNENWGSYFIDANQAGWQKLMVDLTADFIAQGYDGVFLDTVDTVSVYPETRPGMVALIHGLRQAQPNALIIQNRGMAVAEEVAADLDGIMFEDVSTTYDFETQEYSFRSNNSEIEQMKAFQQSSSLPVLGLDYAPADNPGMAARAIKTSRENGFIPCVSTINLDDIPAYGSDHPEMADVRIRSITAEGDDANVDLVVVIDNAGLSNAADIPVGIQIPGMDEQKIRITLQPGDRYEWKVTWPQPVENSTITITANLADDARPENNSLKWDFTFAAIAMEPLLPFDQQQHRPAGNGPTLYASFMNIAPTIDGDLAEWQGLPCASVDLADQISYGDSSGWSGPQDLSGSICYGWDADHLYLAITILDDQRVQKFTAGNLWQGDHVELWFDNQLQLDFDSETDSDDDYQLGISPGNGSDTPADFFIFTPDLAVESYADLVQWQVIDSENGYTAEINIPETVLKGLRLGAGQTIGATFEPSDTDTPDSSEQELMMSSAPQSSANWGNPTYWNNLTLLAEGQSVPAEGQQ